MSRNNGSRQKLLGWEICQGGFGTNEVRPLGFATLIVCMQSQGFKRGLYVDVDVGDCVGAKFGVGGGEIEPIGEIARPSVSVWFCFARKFSVFEY